jgi:hypothetical protein
VQHLSYDNSPTPADDSALWSNFAALSPVNFDPTPGLSVAATPLKDIVGQSGGHHNVVLMLPSSVRQPEILSTVDHVHATFVTTPGSPPSSSTPQPSIPEAYAWASTVSPASPAAYNSANKALQTYPTTYSPPLGSLKGKGLYQSQLIYSLSGSNLNADVAMFTAFSGLIPANPDQSAAEPSSGKPGSNAWELGLWTASFNRNDVLAKWGHDLNIVVSDGVQYDSYVAIVIEQNAVQ